MKNTIADVKEAAAAMQRSYLTKLLPISIFTSILVFGYSHSDKTLSPVPLFALLAFLFMLIPAIAVSRPSTDIRSRLKSLLSAVDGPIIMASLVFLIPNTTNLNSIESFLISVTFGIGFLAMCLALARSIRIFEESQRSSIIADFKLVWANSPTLLLMITLGLSAPAAALGISHGAQALTRAVTPDYQDLVAMIAACLLIMPATFFPFFLLSQKIKRSVVGEPEEV